MSEQALIYQSVGDRLYEAAFRDLQVGQVFHLEELGKLIGVDLTVNRAPLYAAIERALKEQNRLVETVWGTMTYEVIAPDRVPEAIARRLERGLNQFRFAERIGRYHTEEGMSPRARSSFKFVRHEASAIKRGSQHTLNRIKSELEDFDAAPGRRAPKDDLEGLTKEQLLRRLRSQR